MTPGSIVLTPAGDRAIIAEQRGTDFAVLVINESGWVSFDYVPYNRVVEAPPRPEADDELKEVYGYFNLAKKYSNKYEAKVANGGQVKKAANPNERVFRIGGRTVRALVKAKYQRRQKYKGRWVYDYGPDNPATHPIFRKKGDPKAPKVKSQRAKTEAEKEVVAERFGEAETKKWRDHMTPAKDEYKKIQNGDSDALANYVMRVLWEPAEGVTTSPKTATTTMGQDVNMERTGLAHTVRALSRTLIGRRPEAFEPEDVLQEATLNLLKAQAEGRFKSKDKPIDRDGFVSYVAQTVKFTANNLHKQAHLDSLTNEAIGEAMESLSKRISKQELQKQPQMTRDVGEQAIQSEEDVQKIGKMRQVINETYGSLKPEPKEVFKMAMAGKSLEQMAKKTGKTVAGVKGVRKRVYGKFRHALASEKLIDPDAADIASLKDTLREHFDPKAALKKRAGELKQKSGRKTRTTKKKTSTKRGAKRKRAKSATRKQPARIAKGYIVRRNGRLILMKALQEQYRQRKKVGGKWVYDYGPDDPRTHPTFKQGKDKGQGEQKTDKKKSDTSDQKDAAKQKRREALTNFLKNIAKGFVSTMATTMGGESAAQEATQTGERSAEDIKQIERTRQKKKKKKKKKKKQKKKKQEKPADVQAS